MFKCQQTLETRSISARLSERGFIAHFCMIYARTRCTLKFLIDRSPNECCIKSRNVCFLPLRAFVGAANVKCYSKQLKHYLRLRFEPREMPLVIIIEEKATKAANLCNRTAALLAACKISAEKISQSFWFTTRNFLLRHNFHSNGTHSRSPSDHFRNKHGNFSLLVALTSSFACSMDRVRRNVVQG